MSTTERDSSTPSICRRLDKRWYPGYPDNWDDDLLRHHVLGATRSSDALLDLGAGAGIVDQMDFREVVASVTGLDPDQRVGTNPFLNHAIVGMAEAIPCRDSVFDIVVSDNVFEHLPTPGRVVQEVYRVLKPGGKLIVKTPNRWHYVALAAQLTPTAFHRWFNSLRGRDSTDTFRTQYRANTPKALRELSTTAGFKMVSIHLIEGRPEYLRMNPVSYLFGWIYERLVNRFEILSRFRVLIIAELEKA